MVTYTEPADCPAKYEDGHKVCSECTIHKCPYMPLENDWPETR